MQIHIQQISNTNRINLLQKLLNFQWLSQVFTLERTNYDTWLAIFKEKLHIIRDYKKKQKQMQFKPYLKMMINKMVYIEESAVLNNNVLQQMQKIKITILINRNH
ncbi:unnamed protein product [Paramecium sonneborni]|uniref:Uncharacterized protein n=1 Tax=Paramecium sonneborni TaxID=65129 RepID=A0A8S1N588_9CILI|nr:unnamed protein product [Paramecium sonneborni]